MFAGMTNLHSVLPDYQYQLMCKQFHQLQAGLQHLPKIQMTEKQRLWYESIGSFHMSKNMQDAVALYPIPGVTDSAQEFQRFLELRNQQIEQLFLGGGGLNPNNKDPFRHITKGRVVRKEYRMMTDFERNRFHDALNQMKTTLIDGISQYDIIVLNHGVNVAPGAHFGAAFLPFHREYVLR